jgi:hypothetical protein
MTVDPTTFPKLGGVNFQAELVVFVGETIRVTVDDARSVVEELLLESEP